MKKNSFLLIFLLLAFVAPIGVLLLAPDIPTILRRINALEGEILLFSTFASLGLILTYLAYRLVYSGEGHKNHLEYSATALAVHLLSQALFVLALAGALPVYHLFDVNKIASALTWVSILMVISTLLHLALDLPLYTAKTNVPLEKLVESAWKTLVPGITGSFITIVVAVLFFGAIMPSQLPAAIIVSIALLWEILYLSLAVKIVSKTFIS